jgi:dTDP-4-dehydrorhamnose reductase
VTGAGGMLGRDVVQAAEHVGHEVIALARQDLDVVAADAVTAAISDARPQVVFNCAAWTDVDGAEDDEPQATVVNGEGAGNVAAAAASVEAKVVYVSTDYVFDGSKGGPYVESDQAAPLSGYGRSKLAGEEATAAANPRHFNVRSSWLFGLGGRNFVETMLQLAEDHGEVLVVRDQIGCPTYTGHLAAGIVRLVEGSSYGIHHMAGEGACSWYDFAQEIFDQSGVECRVMSGTTDMLGRKAPRPSYSELTTQRSNPIVLPNWRQGLSSYLAERAEARATAEI